MLDYSNKYLSDCFFKETNICLIILRQVQSICYDNPDCNKEKQ